MNSRIIALGFFVAGICLGGVVTNFNQPVMAQADNPWLGTDRIVAIFPQIEGERVRLWVNAQSLTQENPVWTNIIVNNEDTLVLALDGKMDVKHAGTIVKTPAGTVDVSLDEVIRNWREKAQE